METGRYLDEDHYGGDSRHIQKSGRVLKPSCARIGVAILEKTPGRYNLSFKSSEFDMVPLAKKFGGGGHTESAGTVVETDDLNELIRKIVNSVEEFFDFRLC